MRKIFGFIASLFTHLGDWISDRHALVEEVNRLRQEVSRLESYSKGLIAMSEHTSQEARETIDERNAAIQEQRLQIAHLNELLFECRGKSDAAERSRE